MSEPIVVDGQTLHPELQFLLQLRAQRPDAKAIPDMTPEEIRAVTQRESILGAGEPTAVGAVKDLTVDGAVGPLKARHYAPSSPSDDLLVFFHGGGFVFGDLETHDGTCRLLCAAGGFNVLAVEYALAPEHPFPAGVEDAWAAWQWVVANAETLGASQIAVSGDSAGALLATVVSQLAARTGARPPALQVLIYPPIDAYYGRSLDLFGEGYFLTRRDIDYFEASLFDGVDADPNDFRHRPMQGDLTGLAPAIVITGGFDPLRDGGEAYVAALVAAGTPAILRRYDGMIHGFVNMIGFSPACRAAVVEIAQLTAERLAAGVQQGHPDGAVAPTG
jgi:acetyl esterase